MEITQNELHLRFGELEATIRRTTPEDSHLATYDHTKLAAINTCPVYGIVRYQMHKRMPMVGRALALEAGSAMHEVFAWVRLVSLCDQRHQDGSAKDYVDKLWEYHGTRLFGTERMQHLQGIVSEAEDMVDVAKRGSIGVLDTSGYYDDPKDKRRTLNNMEECTYAYINRWRWDHPVWMRDLSDPTSDVGIEIPFDTVVSINGMEPFRFVGIIDGIHYDRLDRLTIHDNKTASRLGDAWTQAQELSHQYTGYCITGSVFIQQLVERCDVLGLAIPLPKSYDYGGFARESMSRTAHHQRYWLQWLVHTITLMKQYENNPFDAPRYTHSCNRYFRPCSMIPFCAADREEQEQILTEMETDEWNPLDREIKSGVGNE